MQNYRYIVGYVLQFFPENFKFQPLSTNKFTFLKKVIYFKGKVISVSFLACGNDTLIILCCVYLASYLTGKFCFKIWEKHNGKVTYLLRKWQFLRVNIYKIIISWHVKLSNHILFLPSLETWKHLKHVLLVFFSPIKCYW